MEATCWSICVQLQIQGGEWIVFPGLGGCLGDIFGRSIVFHVAINQMPS